jgi:DNA-binding transcriptional LysR family regulator
MEAGRADGESAKRDAPSVMDLRHLRYFVAVAEEQNFTRAAERLWIAQPGLSQQIRSLEKELGICLFERTSKGVELTEVGRLFLDKARVALAAADDALSAGRNAGAGLVGNLRIGLTTQVRSDLCPAIIGAYSAQRPEVDVTVVEAESDTLVGDLRDGRLDAAIVLGPVTLRNARAVLLKEARVHVAMSEAHPLAAREAITARDLQGAVVAVSGERGGASYDGVVAELLRSRGIDHELLAAGYGPAMLAPVRAGTAVALIPFCGADPDRGLASRALDPAATFRFELVWQEGVTSGVLAGFIEAATAAVARPAPAQIAA